MNGQIVAAANLSLFVLLMFLVFVWIPRIRVAEFQQKMFELRDQMFDAAANQELAFSDAAYIALRNTMNGLIRTAERISFAGVVSFILAKSITKDQTPPAMPPSLEEIKLEEDVHKRKQYHEFHRNMDMLVLQLLIKRNVLLHCLLALERLRMRVIRPAITNPLARSHATKSWSRAMENHAFIEGSRCAA
jgi:hypothetical protein